MTVSWEFIDELAATLPKCEDTSDEQKRQWCVRGKAIAWERPLSKKDMAALGEAAPKGRVLAVHVPDLGIKQGWIETVPGVCFSSPHFATYPAVLVDLELADEQIVRELFTETAEWLANG